MSQGLTSWLLPWLALTAQMPFETKDKQTNFMALILALGSPSLITFSLVLTILNSKSINKRFRQIKKVSESLDRPLLAKAVKASRIFLIESQHVPIQIFNGPRREFAQLVVRPENWVWWDSLREEIQKTKREWTYSLYAQVGLVCFTQVLAIVGFFTTASLNTDIGIGLAINSLWLWLIPVVLGWVYVGTQTSAGSIKAAIARTKVPVLGDKRNLIGECIGIRDRTTFDSIFDGHDRYSEKHPRDQRATTSSNAIPDPVIHSGSTEDKPGHTLSNPYEIQEDCRKLLSAPARLSGVSNSKQGYPPSEGSRSREKFRNGRVNANAPHDPEQQISSVSHPRSFLGFSLAGCELEIGPIFNCARVWSHNTASNHIGEAFAMLVQLQKNEKSVNGEEWDQHNLNANLEGSPDALSKYTSISYKDEPDLPVHARASKEMVINCIVAAFVAMFLQWGSTGAALIIAYG